MGSSDVTHGMMSSSGDTQLELKLHQGEELLSSLAAFSSTPGCDKLVRKVRAELRFLQRLQQKPHPLRQDQLRSSNLDSLSALVARVAAAGGLSAILATFPTGEPGVRLVVDVVADGGATWIKVISRNPRALQRLSLGQGEFGQKTVLDQARQYTAAADKNRHQFRRPLVEFSFSAGVGCGLARRLTALGIRVTGERIRDDRLGMLDACQDGESEDGDEQSNHQPHFGDGVMPSGSDTRPDEPLQAFLNTDPVPSADTAWADSPPADAGEPGLNLDVTALLAYVSNLTNGRCHVTFSEQVLAQQAAWERVTPVKPKLDDLFRQRRLYCCRSAHDAFVSIVGTVGGQQERRRAEQLVARLTVVDDMASPVTQLLEARGKVRRRSAVVFGTGEALRVPTVTANTGFVRAAAGQGVRLTAITHGSRALSEAKEQTAGGSIPERQYSGTAVAKGGVEQVASA